MLQIPLLLLGLVVFTIGCKKNPIPPTHGGGGNGHISNAFRFSIDSLPGERVGINGLSVLITILNDLNQPVLTDKKMSLRFSGKYVSDTVILPNGNYKLSSFLVIDDTTKRFATPIGNSPKASAVQRPLSISFDLPKSTESTLSIEVARINAGDQPESFGYPKGTWTTAVDNPPPPPISSVKIKVRPMIKIGDVTYDSIPVNFTWITWDASGKMIATAKIALPAGTNEVTLPSNAFKYNLQVERWGIHDEIELLKANVQEGTVYSLGGSKAAKKLKSELVYNWVNGAYQPTSKSAYEYDASGRPFQIIYYLRKADNTPYIAMTDKFSYNAMGKVERVKRYDSNSTAVSETNFRYDLQGKIIGLSQTEGNKYTSGEITYAGQGAGSYNMSIQYNSTQQPHTKTYNMVYKGGNKAQDNLLTINNSNESGTYQYDYNINPYIHMNWPDFYLTKQSRNNLTAQQRLFTQPVYEAIPYGFNYTYDADGYPKELIKTYFSYYGGTYMYSTKTVFNY
jgi:hypothetical protein